MQPTRVSFGHALAPAKPVHFGKENSKTESSPPVTPAENPETSSERNIFQQVGDFVINLVKTVINGLPGLGGLPTAVATGGKAIGQNVILQVPAWNSAMSSANPDSNFHQRIIALVDLAGAQFRQALLHATPDEALNQQTQQQTIYKLYHNVLSQFPGLILQAELPIDVALKATEVSEISASELTQLRNNYATASAEEASRWQEKAARLFEIELPAVEEAPAQDEAAAADATDTEAKPE